ncbi:hypothetical protein CRYUN_Cryun10bG0150800 [Craigia yunnanensis]
MATTPSNIQTSYHARSNNLPSRSYPLTSEVLQLPLTQQILAQEQQKEYVDELLNGSVRLLDVCTTAKDALLQVKESTLYLQSILRRMRCATTRLANEVKKYLASRRQLKRQS